MKRLIIVFAAAALACGITACVTEEPTTDIAALIDPFDIWTEDAIADKESNALCPDEERDECAVFDAARVVWSAIDSTCTDYDDGVCIGSRDIAGVGPTAPLWIECNVTPSGNTCGCELHIGGLNSAIIGIYADFGCDGTGSWLDFVGATVCDIVPCCDPSKASCG